MRAILAFALPLLFAAAPMVQAGPAADELSRCLVQSTSNEDKITLVKWMFASMSLHPAVAELSTVNDTTRDAANQDMAALLVLLLEERCFNQARAAIQSEGSVALQNSFAILGQAAANELFTNPNVAAGLGALTEFLDAVDLDRKLGIGGDN